MITIRASYHRTASIASIALASTGRHHAPQEEKQSTLRREEKEKVPSLSTNVEPLSIVARATVVESNGVEGKGFDSEPSLPLQQISSSKSNLNLGAESDAEIEEIGALIYDQVMQRRQSTR